MKIILQIYKKNLYFVKKYNFFDIFAPFIHILYKLYK